MAPPRLARWPWVVYPALAGAVALAFSALVTWPREQDRARGEALAHLADVARERADGLASHVRTLRGVTGAVSSFPSVEDLLGDRPADAPLPYDPAQGVHGHLADVLADMRERLELEALTVVDARGRDLIPREGGPTVDAAAAWAPDGARRPRLVAGPGGRVVLVVASPTGGDGDRGAAVIAIQDARTFVGRRLGPATRQYRTSHVWLAQREPDGASAFRVTDDGAVVRDPIHAAAAPRVLGEGGRAATGADGSASLTASAPLEGVGWSVLVDADPSEVDAMAFRATIAVGRPIALVLVLLAVGLVWLWRRRMRRDALAREAADLSQERVLARLGTAIEQATEAIVTTDARGVIDYANPAFEALTGWSRAEAIGQTPRILKSGAQSPAFYVELWRRLGRGEVVQTQLTNRRKDGTRYVAELTITPVRDADGVIRSYVALQHDVTRERELDEQLRQVQRIEAIGQLTGGIAHDFNNLLAIILSNAALLDDALRGAEPDTRAAFDDLSAAARRGAELVRKLLAFGRRDAVDLRPLDVARAVEDTLRAVRRVIPETIAIRTELDRVPKVRADAGSLDQILINLLTNARDAMPDGGVVRVSVREGRRDSDPEKGPTVDAPATRSFVEITVSDTGHGMDDATRKRVFEPFYTTKPQGKGTGLGLAMVHGLVHLHGGAVRVESEAGQGTTVVIELPVATGPDHAASVAAPAQALEAGGETVLFVEDEPALRRVAVRTLERLGYTVLTASDGQEALDLWAQTSPLVDVLVTDVVMPKVGGLDLTRTLRESDPNLPVVLVTGHASVDLDDHLTRLPGVRVVQKPWTVLELTRAIRAALGGPTPSTVGPRRRRDDDLHAR